MGPLLKYGQAGMELTWSWLNALLKQVLTNRINCGPNSGLSMVKIAGVGTFLRVSDPTAGAGQLAITDGTISACVKTTLATTGCPTSPPSWAPGTGFVYFLNYNGTCWVQDDMQNYSVLNFSTTTGGIATGTLVWLSLDNGGNWVISAVDCAN